jgi:hypothetical protein
MQVIPTVDADGHLESHIDWKAFTKIQKPGAGAETSGNGSWQSSKAKLPRPSGWHRRQPRTVSASADRAADPKARLVDMDGGH